jgi:hypothetical protein
MTGNTLTLNPITGTNAYANGAYGSTQPGFWGSSFGGNTPSVFGTQAFQTQVPMNLLNPFTSSLIQQQPGFVGQPTSLWQTGFNNPLVTSQWQTGFNNPQITAQAILNAALQTTPTPVINTILQTTPPQVLPYILNALACQQVCQQVVAQNPQAIQALNAQAFTQSLNAQGINQPYFGYGMTNQGQYGFGGTIGGFGVNTVPYVGVYQGQTVPQFLQGQGSCAGCAPGMQQWVPNTVGFQGSFGQIVPQQPWFNTTYGTW